MSKVVEGGGIYEDKTKLLATHIATTIVKIRKQRTETTRHIHTKNLNIIYNKLYILYAAKREKGISVD